MASDVAAQGRLAENLRGSGYMTASMLGFSANDAFVKGVLPDLPVSQAVFLRGLVTTALIALLAWSTGALSFHAGRRDRRLIGVRSLAEIGGTACFLTALAHMPLAGASAILQSVPLALTLAAAVIFDEPVGWRRYLAIAIGFVGVLIIVRPGTEGFDIHALWAIAAIVFIIVRDLSTRRMSPDVRTLQVALATSAVLTAAAGLGAGLEDWHSPAPGHLLALATAAACLLVGYIFSVNSMRTGEIGFVQPFRYSLLVWAMLFGILMFGEWPDLWMLTGSAIVVATGLFTLYRERRTGLGRAG